MNSRSIYLIAIFVCINGYAHASFPRYRVTDMRPLLPYGGSINAMNSLGDMAGRTNEAIYRMQLWQGANHNYSVIGGIPETNFLPSIYTDSGVVGGGSSHYAALWRNGSGFELLPRDGWMGGGVGDTAWKVSKYNESLQIVAGYNEVNVGSNQTSSLACRWEKVNGTWTKIMSPVVNGKAMWFAEDMDSQGNIVGTGQLGSQYGVPMYWSKAENSLKVLAFPSDGVWQSDGKFGFDSSGHIVGTMHRTTGDQSAVLYYDNPDANPERFLRSDSIGSSFTNIMGLVVARAFLGSSENSIVWSRENGFARIKDILEPGTPSMDFGLIKDLNDNGSIVLAGRYTSGGGWFYARLDPVPEPTSLLLLAPGLTWIVLRRRRK